MRRDASFPVFVHYKQIYSNIFYTPYNLTKSAKFYKKFTLLGAFTAILLLRAPATLFQHGKFHNLKAAVTK